MLYTYSSATREAEEEEKLQLKASLDSTVRWCLKREREKSITGKKESIHKAMGSFSNTAKLFKIPWVSNLSSYCKSVWSWSLVVEYLLRTPKAWIQSPELQLEQF